jgi:hypothetical protein
MLRDSMPPRGATAGVVRAQQDGVRAKAPSEQVLAVPAHRW